MHMLSKINEWSDREYMLVIRKDVAFSGPAMGGGCWLVGQI